MVEVACDFCGEAVEGEPIRRGSKVYCCEACAFEGSRSSDCAGRGDSVMRTSTTESGQE
jgi:hypothetical protein